MKLLTVTGTLPKGLLIDGALYRVFEMREAELADMIEAEAEVGSAHQAIAYNAELAVRQLCKVRSEDGREFGGPFVVSMIKKRGDFLALRKAQMELDELGNAEPSASSDTGTQSN